MKAGLNAAMHASLSGEQYGLNKHLSMLMLTTRVCL